MVKRGRPTKVNAELMRKCKNYEDYIARQKEAIKGLQSDCDLLENEWRQSDKKLIQLKKDYAEAKKLADDRFISGQVMAKQIVAAEDKIKELLTEVRQYEHEIATLRYIIIDALRGYER